MDKMREATLICFGHVKRKFTNTPIRRCERLVILIVSTRRSRGKSKKNIGGSD